MSNTQIKYQQITFLKSVAQLSQLPPDQGIEVAFAGRSNVGKSSVLNTLVSIKKIARTSKTPGCTQYLNFFQVMEAGYLVDLPGYGYAKVPLAIKRRWQETLLQYIESRLSLRGLIVVMDIRHPLKEYDIMLLEYARAYNREVHILLNKSDKLKKGAAKAVLLAVQKFLHDNSFHVSVQLYSALKKTGQDEARKVLERWFT